MAAVVSLINMKGGVGKTTICAQLAHDASSMRYRTLAVDLDPQANLSQALLGQFAYRQQLFEDVPTVDNVVRGYVPPNRKRTSPEKFNIRSAIKENVGRRDSGLDLLPSRLQLASTLRNPNIDPQGLARAIAELAERYDLILIDCAPTESILTEAAYHASRFLLVPVKPEYLATIGLPLLATSVGQFKAANRKHALDIVGIVINHATYGSQKDRGVEQSLAEVRKEASKNKWRVFAHEFPYSRSWPKAARDGTTIHRTKSARRTVQSRAILFLNEFLSSVNVRRGQ